MILAAALAGCAIRPTVYTIQAKDGAAARYVECPRTVMCHTAARETCAGDYLVVDESHSSSVIGTPGLYGTIITPIEKNRLLFRCS